MSKRDRSSSLIKKKASTPSRGHILKAKEDLHDESMLANENTQGKSSHSVTIATMTYRYLRDSSFKSTMRMIVPSASTLTLIGVLIALVVFFPEEDFDRLVGPVEGVKKTVTVTQGPLLPSTTPQSNVDPTVSSPIDTPIPSVVPTQEPTFTSEYSTSTTPYSMGNIFPYYGGNELLTTTSSEPLEGDGDSTLTATVTTQENEDSSSTTTSQQPYPGMLGLFDLGVDSPEPTAQDKDDSSGN